MQDTTKAMIRVHGPIDEGREMSIIMQNDAEPPFSQIRIEATGSTEHGGK
jgi:hypothetical protein